MKNIRHILYCLLLITLAASCAEDRLPSGGQLADVPCVLNVDRSVHHFVAQGSSTELGITSKNVDWKLAGAPSWLTLSQVSGTGAATVAMTAAENKDVDKARVAVLQLESTTARYEFSTNITVDQEAAKIYLDVDRTSLSFTPQTTQATVAVNTNIEWEPVCSAAWLTLSKTDVATLSVKADENTTDGSRTATITLRRVGTATALATIVVVQSEAGVTGSTETVVLDVDGGTKSIDIEADVTWSATSSATSWLSVTPTSGVGGKVELKISALANKSTAARSGFVYVKIGSEQKLAIPVSQEGVSLNVNGSLKNFAADGGSKQTLTVESNTAWVVLSCPEWLTVTPEQAAKGSTEITLRASENNSLNSRSATLRIGIEGLSIYKDITVAQEPVVADLGDSSIEFGWESSQREVEIVFPGSWSAIVTGDWISLSQSSGNGGEIILVTAKVNDGEDTRQGSVTIASEGRSIKISVIQQGQYLKINSTAGEVGAMGGSVSLTVTTSVGATAVVEYEDEAKDWVAFDSDDNGIFTLQVAYNPSANSRTAQFVIKPTMSTTNTACTSGVKFAVTQRGRALAASVSAIAISVAGGESATYTITADSTYTITKPETDDWYTLQQDSANCTFSIVATENTTGAERSSLLTVSLTGLPKDEVHSIDVEILQYDEYNGYEFVDLGLPSGVKWATCNVGATQSHESGSCYAWGETEEKENYDWSTYKWCGGSETSMTKYCTNSSYGTVDNKTVLAPEDDAAHVNWGGCWRMPTYKEQKELIDNCTWTWITQSGVEGYKVTGTNGNSIFLPAVTGNSTKGMTPSNVGGYWSNTLVKTLNSYAYHLYFDESGSFDIHDSYNRCNARSVRPVCGGEYTVSVSSEGNGAVSINGNPGTSAKLGAASTITVVAIPEEGYVFSGWFVDVTGLPVSTDAEYTFTLSEDIALVAKFEKEKTIVDGYAYVDLGLPSGVMWADCNVGATQSYESGSSYAWGETEEKSEYSWANYKWCGGSETTIFKYCTSNSSGTVDNKTVLAPEDDAAHVNWGGNWRMPTYKEQKELIDNCTWTWITLYGVEGYKVTGTNGNSIFLPAVTGNSTRGMTPSNVGGYWSNTLVKTLNSYAYHLYFDESGSFDIHDSYNRCNARSVRPVCGGEYTVSVSSEGNGSVSINGNPGASAKLGATSVVTLIATPDDGYVLEGWYVYGTETPVCTDAEYTFTVIEDIALVAKFSKKPVVKISCNDGGAVSFKEHSGDSIVVSRGTELTIVATPDEAYAFEGWYVDGAETPVSINAEYTFTVSEDVALVAKFNLLVYEAVELGLPSGIKWATFNVGATRPEEYGGYYAWGETEEKDNYDWSTYKWCNGSNNSITKYCTDGSYGTVDNKTTLDPEDDVAHVEWGGSWRMPTRAEQDELRNNCTWTWTTQNGVNGYKVTSKTNGNSIFLPAAGYRSGVTLYAKNTEGHCWTTLLYSSDGSHYANTLRFFSVSYALNSFNRNFGLSVRPVCGEWRKYTVTVNSAGNGNVAVKDVDGTSATIEVGSTVTVVATPDEAYAFEGWYVDGTETPVSTNAEYTFTVSEDVALVAKFNLLVYEAVDLGLPSGIKWATFNVGATRPEEYGGYYAWGETEEKDNYDWSTYKWCNGSYNSITKYCTDGSYGTVDNKTTLDPEDDVAHVKWGDSWRMPTSKEQQELLDNCTWTWTTQNGINGYKVTSKTNGNSIFLPPAGYRSGTETFYIYSYYLSSSLSPDRCAPYLFSFSHEFYKISNFERANGLSVRPVCGEWRKFSVSVGSEANGSVAISGYSGTSAMLDASSKVTVIATPNEGYSFSGWYTGSSETLVSTNAEYTFTVIEDVALVARFEVNELGSANGDYYVKYGADVMVGSLRYPRSVGIVGAQSPQQQLNDIASATSHAAYFDKTSTVFEVKSGETVTPTILYTGSWMHGYVFVDWDNSKQFEVNLEGDGPFTKGEGNELMCWSFYGKDGEDIGWNSAGSSLRKQDFSVAPGSFRVPDGLVTGSTYRMRFAIMWNCIDPSGDYADFINDGGSIIDVTLKIIGDADDEIIGDADDETDPSPFDSDKLYTISSQRAFLLYQPSTNALVASTGTAVNAVQNPQDPNQQFQIKRNSSGYQLYSVGAGGYAVYQSIYNVQFDSNAGSKLTITETGNSAYPWKLQLGDYPLNAQEEGQCSTGLVVNTWSYTDAGNSYILKEVVPPVTHIVSVSSEGNGSVAISGNSGTSATFETGASVTVVATPDEGYAFSGWYDGDALVSTDAEYTFTVSEGVSLVAMFREKTYIGGYEYVDLGLPSGLKWATCNVGATKPEEYGGYYAWGETEEKENYSWSTYKWCNGSSTTMTKYCTIDNKTFLDPEDDVARVKWGSVWRMPTREEQDELRYNCTWQWTTVNNVKGCRVTGPNGNSIFLPAGGYRRNSSIYNAELGHYWSSSYFLGISSYDLGINNEGHNYGNGDRAYGHLVRPVYGEQNTYTVSVSSDGNGVVACFDKNVTSVTIPNASYTFVVATPNEGYSFEGWYVDGSQKPVAITLEYSFVVNENVSLVAKFRKGNNSASINNLSQLDNNTIVTITSGRAFLMYSSVSGLQGQICSSTGKLVGNIYQDPNDVNQQFRIVKSGDKYYLYSMGAGKYVDKNGNYTGIPTDDLTLENVGGEIPWKLMIGGNAMNSQVAGQFDAGIVLSSWTTTDSGNCYMILVVDAGSE